VVQAIETMMEAKLLENFRRNPENYLYGDQTKVVDEVIRVRWLTLLGSITYVL